MSKQYYLYCFIVFVISSKGSRINLSEDIKRINPLKPNVKLIGYKLENGGIRKERFMNHLITVLNHKKKNTINHDSNKKNTTKCDRNFGSVLDTKLKKLQCVYKLIHNKIKQLVKRTIMRLPKYFVTESNELPIYNYPKYVGNYVDRSKHTFEDSRDESIQYDDYLDIMIPEDSSDVTDLHSPNNRRKLPQDYYDYLFDLHFNPIKLKKKTHTIKKCPLAGRKSERIEIVSKNNKMTNKLVRAATDVSGDNLLEIKKQSTPSIPFLIKQRGATTYKH